MNVSTTIIRNSTLTDNDGREFPLTHEPCDWIDPVIIHTEQGATIRYALHDYAPMEWEWSEGVEFELFSDGYERNQWIIDNLETCAECFSYKEHHVEGDADYDADPHDFRPVTEWTDRMFWVERYEHGNVCYALVGESSQIDRMWDVAQGVAIITIADDFTNPEEAARAMLKEYTSWCNGDVYGICEEDFVQDPDGEWVSKGDPDSCWGFIGSEYVEETLKTGF